MRSKTYIVEGRDSLELLSKEKEPLKSEYIDSIELLTLLLFYFFLIFLYFFRYSFIKILY